MQEETGIFLSDNDVTLRGVVDFKSDNFENERMYLYTAKVTSDYYNEDCNEGNLKWVDKKDILSLNMWEGDHVFLKKLLSECPYFELSLIYGGKSGETLLRVDECLIFN